MTRHVPTVDRIIPSSILYLLSSIFDPPSLRRTHRLLRLTRLRRDDDPCRAGVEALFGGCSRMRDVRFSHSLHTVREAGEDRRDGTSACKRQPAVVDGVADLVGIAGDRELRSWCKPR